MIPKEKAEELVNQYRMILMDEDTDCGNEILCSLIAIKSALIAVDEIIKQTPEFIPQETYIGDSCGVDYFMNEMFEYWKEVKQEIDKL